MAEQSKMCGASSDPLSQKANSGEKRSITTPSTHNVHTNIAASTHS